MQDGAVSLIRDNLDIITELTQAWTQAETQVGDIYGTTRVGVVDV